jgi:hypothetical protein
LLQQFSGVLLGGESFTISPYRPRALIFEGSLVFFEAPARVSRIILALSFRIVSVIEPLNGEGLYNIYGA